MIIEVKKDITTVQLGIVIHGVNCQRVMGSGVALAIKTKWPEIYEAYMAGIEGPNALGNIGVVNIDENLQVVNCYTQEYYGRDGQRYADLDAIGSCLYKVISLAYIQEMPIYMPKIGCGLGGLSWRDEVLPLLEELAAQAPSVDIYVCDI